MNIRGSVGKATTIIVGTAKLKSLDRFEVDLHHVRVRKLHWKPQREDS